MTDEEFIIVQKFRKLTPGSKKRAIGFLDALEGRDPGFSENAADDDYMEGFQGGAQWREQVD